PPDTATTTLLDVEIGVGRTGALTPTAQLEPVRLGGTTVKAASLHNWDEIDRLGVMIGDRIEVQKAGEVIPQVLRGFPEHRTGAERPIPRPAHCPVCGSAVMQEAGKVGYRCVGLSCKPQLVRRLEYFTSRPAMRIEGLGIKITERFFDLGWLQDVADIYHLHRHAEEMKQLEGFGETSVRNLLTAIEGSKAQPLWRVLTALGIPGVGPEVAKLLEAALGTSQRLEAATVEELTAIAGIGPILAHQIAAFFDDINNMAVMAELREAGLEALQPDYRSPLVSPPDGPLTGKSIVVTGSFTDYTRGQLQEMIARLGGKAGSSVSKKTDLVLVGADPGSKADKARELKVPTVEGDQGLQEWLAALGIL
ncbi:MAG TPA: NAD-dependent DNA ligase LigA, partial [bacterium]|nr:NAD-dependent DNA ligase LigA [bacterium]